MKRAHDTIASIVRSFSHIQFISGIIAHGPYSVFKIVENYTLACPTPRHVDFVHTDSGKNFTQGNVEPFVTVGVTARAAASYIPNLFLESSRMYDSHFSALWHYRRKSGKYYSLTTTAHCRSRHQTLMCQFITKIAWFNKTSQMIAISEGRRSESNLNDMCGNSSTKIWHRTQTRYNDVKDGEESIKF
ncbi:hypothetical protein BLNAU_15292 [Blattamonas nauphoetae]|uniref:Uncharacterized protein n=1 Tax=Blattamonas nauphoetae TaxID=2049346 RepID=A0ABQ9WL85_9EUKA|nr:hypothetical protein BLNAU_24875 [Blattamonas nauphoetae]KAK2949718.1 hypothetical protein BLNAU_15292 [Blattamonas nauphoetae]